MPLEKILSDFIVGGFLIAVVLAAANFVGPFMTGIIAALPVRIWATLLLGGVTGTDVFVTEMLLGVIPGSIGSLSFMIVLSRITTKQGVPKSFFLAFAVCMAVTCISLAVL